MIFTDLVGIIADDLTGANDTALQFHNQGAKTKILLDTSYTPDRKDLTEVWAISSESKIVMKKKQLKELSALLKILQKIFRLNIITKKSIRQ